MIIEIIVVINKLYGGWASLAISIWFIGGILISLGLIGEYIGKIYLEVKKRTKYIVDATLENRSTELKNGTPKYMSKSSVSLTLKKNILNLKFIV
jgi:hypothetical protein